MAAGGALVVSCALVVEALGGILFYTTQGEICQMALNRLRSGKDVDIPSALSTCSNRHGTVYRAFFVEIAAGVVLFGSAWYVLRRARSRAK